MTIHHGFGWNWSKSLLFLAAAAMLWHRTAAAASLSISPSATSNTYTGTITLQVTGLASGETVVIQKFLDANRNGVIDAGDILWQQFQLTDGQASVFHDGATAVTNLNIPGDTDSTPGQITAKLNLPLSGFEQTIVGRYLYKLSSPSGNFSPITNSFTVTNFPYAQSFSGSVMANSTNVPDAVVLLFQPSDNGNMTPQGGTVADNSGNYTLSAAPGNYMLTAVKSSFVANTGTSPSLSLTNGAAITTNLSLASADRTLAGSVVDASNSAAGLAGLLVPLSSKNGLLCIAFTDTNGNFNGGVTSDNWKVQPSDAAMGFHGYLRSQHKLQVDATAGSVSGVNLALPKASALFYGSVKDTQNQPMAGISLFSSDNTNYEQNVTSDANGNYFAGALSGTNDPWRIEISSGNNNPTNYVFSAPDFDFNQNGGTNLNSGQAVLANFTALLATNRITGHVQDSNNHPITNVQVFASALIGGSSFQAQGYTDGSGNYSLNVGNAAWSVGVSCQGGNNSLDSILGPGNFQCPDNQNVNITNSNGSANFTVLPCGGIQISTPSPLPNGQVGSYYSTQFNGSSCNGGLNWSLNLGTVPPGLTLYSGGAFNGTPSTNGTFNFTVHASDGGVNSTNQNFSLTINPAPTSPTLGQPSKSGAQFQFSVSASSGQNYTVQMSTNLNSTNWTSMLVTNPVLNSFRVTDPNATNPMRFYRVLLGP